MLASLFRVNGIGLPAGLESVVLHAAPWSVGLLGLDFAGTFPHDLAPWGRGLPWIAGLLAVALLAPNSAQLMRRFRPALLPADWMSMTVLGGGPSGVRRRSMRRSPPSCWCGACPG